MNPSKSRCYCGGEGSFNIVLRVYSVLDEEKRSSIFLSDSEVRPRLLIGDIKVFFGINRG
jgi:hypothetical protein